MTSACVSTALTQAAERRLLIKLADDAHAAAVGADQTAARKTPDRAAPAITGADASAATSVSAVTHAALSSLVRGGA